MTATVLHGVRATYVHQKCRCDECRRANAAYYRRYRIATRRADMSAVVGWVIMRGGAVYDPWPRSHCAAVERLGELRAGLRTKKEREALRIVALVEVAS